MERRRNAGLRRTLAPTLAIPLVLLLATPAIAAELDAVELDGRVNHVTIERGGTSTFRLWVTASGSIRCTATGENPATATFASLYTFTGTGSLVVGPDGGVAAFHADPSCIVTWVGAPEPQVLTSAVAAAEDAPLGTFSLSLRPRLFTPFGSGDRLVDQIPTILSLEIVEPSGDSVPPDVSCEGPNGAAGANGWYTSAVSFACAASDDGSGLADPADAAFTLSTDGEGSVWTDSRTVADAAGNETEVGPFGPFDVDLTDPEVTLTPTDGATFTLGEHVTVSYSCEDAVSGVDSCEGTLADGAVLDTGSVGPQTVQVSATDVAGRTTTVRATYHVVYAVEGPWVPGAAGTHQAGRAVAVQWSLNGTGGPASYVGAAATPVSCADGTPTGAGVQASSPGGSGPSHAKGSDTSTLVVKTERVWAGACIALGISLDDGSTHQVVLTFR